MDVDDGKSQSLPRPPSPKRQRQDVVVDVTSEVEGTSNDNDKEFDLRFHFKNIPNSVSDFPICTPQIREEILFKLKYLEEHHLQGNPIKSVVVTFDRDDWNLYKITVEKRSGEMSEYGNSCVDEITSE
jgi:hypothetical protein